MPGKARIDADFFNFKKIRIYPRQKVGFADIGVEVKSPPSIIVNVFKTETE